jgi:DNA primase
LRPEKLNIKTVPERVKKEGDLWVDFWKRKQRLDEAINRLSGNLAPEAKKRAK